MFVFYKFAAPDLVPTANPQINNTVIYWFGRTMYYVGCGNSPYKTEVLLSDLVDTAMCMLCDAEYSAWRINGFKFIYASKMHTFAG